MKLTIVGLITPHVLRILDIAKQAEGGSNVDWHLRDAVAHTVRELGQQYNAHELLQAYAQGLATAASEANPARKRYVETVQAAAAIAARNAEPLG